MPVVLRLLFSGEHGLGWLPLGDRSSPTGGTNPRAGLSAEEKSEAGGVGVVRGLFLGVGGRHNHRKPIICIFIQHHKMWTGIVCSAVPREGLRPL